VSHFNLPEALNEHSKSGAQTRHDSEYQSNFFMRRPDLEGVLLEALEFSVDDVLSRQFRQHSSTTPQMERELIKSQIEETMRNSRRELQ